MDYITSIAVLMGCIPFIQAGNPMAEFFEWTIGCFIFNSLDY